ncbi:J domain-containing protein [Pseudorhodoferax sp.]|uniref:J domain-containing protein n=1 Tax=Pseudorhodoferax sp. TaxID=1993553 RepID=UPI002DD6886C|nr:J domain-containing protein [Pseudorhodoferax sp.]
MTPLRALSIAQPATAKLSPAQKKFNSLVKRIATQRELLAQWERAVPLYRERREREFAPLLNDYRLLSVEMVRALHRASSRKGLNQTERATIDALTADLAGPLAESAPDEALRAEMKQRYNDHAGSDFDDDGAEGEATACDLARELFGIDIPEDVDLRSPEELMRHLEEQMQADAQAPPERPARKPGKREQQAAEQAQQAGQSLREVYRKLASALHPDREADPAERARKTALMQRVNEAYANNRLLDLLHLQLEVEQIDPAQLASLGTERLKHYNHVLAEQLDELQHEVAATEGAFVLEFGLHPLQRLQPARLLDTLRHQVAQLTLDTHQLRQQLTLLDDLPTLKRWLKMQRQALRVQQDDDLLSLFGR